MAEYFFFFQDLLTEKRMWRDLIWNFCEDVSDDFKKIKFKVNFTNFNVLIINNQLQLYNLKYFYSLNSNKKQPSQS